MASRAKSIHPGARAPLLFPRRERDGARVHRNKSLDGGAFHIFYDSRHQSFFICNGSYSSRWYTRKARTRETTAFQMYGQLDFATVEKILRNSTSTKNKSTFWDQNFIFFFWILFHLCRSTFLFLKKLELSNWLVLKLFSIFQLLKMYRCF